MRRILFIALPLALLLSSCRMQLGRRLLGGSGGVPTGLALPTETLAVTASSVPTQTVVPAATSTPMPTPDSSLVGLPTESAGTTALDFVETMCQAQWFTELGNLPCPGNDSQTATGYVMKFSEDLPGVSPNINILLTFPPQKSVETLFSKYPAFTVKKGDRFRAMLTCLPHKFCDVEFGLSYFDDNGQNGLKHWPYLFTEAPAIADYSLDGLAGQTVQFNLSVRTGGSGADAYAVWVAPHVYRPAP